MSREAKLEVNSDLKDFESAKNNQTILQKVRLEFEESYSNREEAFSDLVSRQINQTSSLTESKNLDRLRVITNMGNISEASSSKGSHQREDQYIQMETQSMKNYLKYKKDKILQKQPQNAMSIGAVKDG